MFRTKPAPLSSGNPQIVVSLAQSPPSPSVQTLKAKVAHKLSLALLASTAATAVAVPMAALAQVTDDKLDAVVVTARKRSEDVLKIPGNVTAFTAKGLEARGIVTLDDLSNFTPGMTNDHASGGSARAGDRSFQSIIIRGMNPSSSATPTTSIFINGTPITAPAMIQALTDVDHVEVLKGPQSAYFGRSTFAGAVNIVSKSPTNVLSGDASVEVGSRRTLKYSADLSGPIIADKLMVTAGVNYDAHDGSYQNAANPGQTLGDQSTRSAHLGITAKPIDNLTVKFYGLWLQNRDGPSATGLYLGTGAYGQSNCTVNATRFLCGTLPGLNTAVSPAQNSTITSSLAAFLKNPGGIIKSSDTIKDFGLKRDSYHNDLSAEYLLPNYGLTLTYLADFNQDKWSELSDLSNEDGSPGGQYTNNIFVPDAFMVQQTTYDVSQEFRIATDAKKPYRALLGVSYIASHVAQALGGASSGPGTVVATAQSQSKTGGIFFSLAYDILPQLTVNFDGRYQEDEEINYTVGASAGHKTGEKTNHNFLPRASIQYRFTPDIMTYFTYSQGANPAGPNSTYTGLPARSKAELIEDGFDVSLFSKPELITNYEYGVKGRFLDGRATLSADIYYDQWTNQLNSISYTFAPNDPNSPLAGASATPTADPISFADNSASSIAKGVEFEANVIPIEHFTVNLSGAYNDTQYSSYNCTSCSPYSSVTGFNAKGKYLPNAPLKSFAVGLQYGNTTGAFGMPADWFVRSDIIYRDGVWLDSSNTVKTPSTTLVNLRAGLSFSSGISVEAYVKNLTNNKSPTSGFVGYDFGSAFVQPAILVGLPDLVTAGLKLKYAF